MPAKPAGALCGMPLQWACQSWWDRSLCSQTMLLSRIQLYMAGCCHRSHFSEWSSEDVGCQVPSACW